MLPGSASVPGRTCGLQQRRAAGERDQRVGPDAVPFSPRRGRDPGTRLAERIQLRAGTGQYEGGRPSFTAADCRAGVGPWRSFGTRVEGSVPCNHVCLPGGHDGVVRGDFLGRVLETG